MPNTSPVEQSSSQQELKINKKVVYAMGICILLLTAIVVGGGMYLLTNKNTQPINQPENQQTSPQPTHSKTQGQPLRSVPTNEKDITLEIDSIKLGQNSLLVNFSLVYDCSPCDKEKVFVSLYDVDMLPLKESFVVDEASNQKYEVIKDANGKPLASDADGGNGPSAYLRRGERIRYYVQFTAPPKGSTVNIHFPGLQPITGIPIE